MKRYLTLSILILAMFLTACGSTGNKSGDNRQIDRVLLTLDSLEEYHAYIEENKENLPKNFIYWEDIAFLGKFNCLVIKSDLLYSFSDASGAEISLHIDSSPTINSGLSSNTIVTSITRSGTGMQNVINTTGSNFVYSRNGFEYLYYRSGELGTITWNVNGMTFQLSNKLSKYPEGRTDTIVGKLLSADDTVANAAFAEITQKLSK